MEKSRTYTLAAAAVTFYGPLISLIERLARRGDGDRAAMATARVNNVVGLGRREGSFVDRRLEGLSPGSAIISA